MGQTDQMPVYNCGSVGAVPVLAEPQPLLTVLEEKLHNPVVLEVLLPADRYVDQPPYGQFQFLSGIRGSSTE
jgi:hypothetical protein